MPVRDADGRIVRWFGTAVDIHDLYAVSESRDLLAKELSHRIKNIFAVVSGLISMSVRKHPEVQGLRRGADRHDPGARPRARLRPPGRGQAAHRACTACSTDLFSPYGSGEQARVAVSGDDVTISARAATPLALVFHELATNSAKYGALSADEGAVDLSIADEGKTLLLRWVERGGPPAKRNPKEGFGSRLVEMSVTGQLGGSWERRFEHGRDGLRADGRRRPLSRPRLRAARSRASVRNTGSTATATTAIMMPGHFAAEPVASTSRCAT